MVAVGLGGTVARMAIAWRVRADDVDVASVRYRCTTPARHLAALGVESTLSWGGSDPLASPRPDAVVFVKAFGPAELDAAERASAAGVRVLLDVCDNLFSRDYPASASGQDPATFRRMAELAAAITTTGPALAEILRREVGARAPVHEIPDPVETPEDVRWAQRFVWRERLRRRSPGALAHGAHRDLRDLGRRLAPVSRGGGDEPRVIWFGNVGSTTPRFGLINLLDASDQLVAAHERTPFRLLILTGDPGEHRARLEALPFQTRFARWHRRAAFRHLPGSAAALVPFAHDDFNRVKSANRAVLALSQGVPVVAARIPSLEPLADCIELDDFDAGLSRYLADPAHAHEHVARAGEVIERVYSGAAVARAWAAALAVTDPSPS
jgi:glycosyltransferase involved in cell wall biosynthesis